MQLEGEARLRLVAGLKKYFHAKQRDGLLSAEGMQLLDWACSMAMDDASRPLGIWQNIHRCCQILHVLSMMQRTA